MNSIEFAKDIKDWRDTTCIICGEVPSINNDYCESELTKLAEDFLEAVQLLENYSSMKFMIIKPHSRSHENPYGEMIEYRGASEFLEKLK